MLQATTQKKVEKKGGDKKKSAVQRIRLHVPGTVLGHRRSKRKQHHNTTLLSIEGVRTKEEARWYLGKRVAYVYKAPTKRRTMSGKETNLRVVWGRLMRTHGSIGVVRAKFAIDLPPAAYGKPVKVMLYPSNI